MRVLLTERRAHWLLAAVLMAQLVGLAAQVSAPTGSGTQLEALSLRLLAPVGWLVERVSDAAVAVSSYFSSRRSLREDNLALRRRAAEMGREVARLQGIEGQLDRLARAEAFARSEGMPLAAAEVIYLDQGARSRVLLLHVAGAGARIDEPVISEAGLVGRVVLASGPYAKVQMITDGSSSVGAMLERSRRQGVVRGRGAGSLAMDFVPRQEDVRVGDAVVTAGIDGVYPRGIAIGTVAAVEPGDELFLDIRVEPAVDFGLLDQVYLVVQEQLPGELTEGGTSARP